MALQWNNHIDSVAVGLADGGVQPWKPEPESPLAFSPDMLHLGAVAGHRLVIWDLMKTKIMMKETEIPLESIDAVAFHPRGGELAVGCSDGTI